MSFRYRIPALACPPRVLDDLDDRTVAQCGVSAVIAPASTNVRTSTHATAEDAPLTRQCSRDEGVFDALNRKRLQTKDLAQGGITSFLQGIIARPAHPGANYTEAVRPSFTARERSSDKLRHVSTVVTLYGDDAATVAETG